MDAIRPFRVHLSRSGPSFFSPQSLPPCSCVPYLILLLVLREISCPLACVLLDLAGRVTVHT